MAYLSMVRGIVRQCSLRKASSASMLLFPTSLSIQPTALWIRSCLSVSRLCAMESVSAKSPLLMKWNVAMMEILRSQRLWDSERA